MFLRDQLVSVAFKRLASRHREGKVHLERTSALLYFLAFDATCKELGSQTLDMNPDSLTGKNNRKQLELEFTKLVLVDSSPDGLAQVLELGKIEFGGNAPNKRISSNFLTVPLKKASVQKEPYIYPRRPNAPLLKMGPASTGVKWGISYHDNWRSNFPKLLTEIRESTPHLDLAIFILRDYPLSNDESNFLPALKNAFRNRFSLDVSDYFSSKISNESIFAQHTNDPFSDHHTRFVHIYKNEMTADSKYESMTKKALIERIMELELVWNKDGSEPKTDEEL